MKKKRKEDFCLCIINWILKKILMNKNIFYNENNIFLYNISYFFSWSSFKYIFY